MSQLFGPEDINFLIEDMSAAQLARLSQRLNDRRTGFLAPPQAVAANLATPVQAGVVQIEYLAGGVDSPPTALNSDSLVRAVQIVDVTVVPGSSSRLELLTAPDLATLASDNWLVIGELYFTRPLGSGDTSGVSVAPWSSQAPSDLESSLVHATACATTAAGAAVRTVDSSWEVVTTFGPFWTGAVGLTPHGTQQRYAVSVAGIWTGVNVPATIGFSMLEPGGVNPLIFGAGSWILGARRAH